MSKLLEKIKNARSLNDILDVVKQVEFDLKNSAVMVKKLLSSMSAGGVTVDTIDGRGTLPKKGTVGNVDTKFVPPNVNSLRKNVDVVHKLNDNLNILIDASTKLQHTFQGFKNQPAALKTVNNLIDEVGATLDDAFSAIAKIAAKHVPKVFDTYTEDLRKYLIDALPTGSYTGEISRILHVAADPADGFFHFCAYLQIPSLKDEMGHAYDHYYIVVTGVVENSGDITYYVNGMAKYVVPTKYPLGKNVSTLAAAKKQVSYLLAYNKFLVDEEQLVLPFTADDAKTTGLLNVNGVTGLDVVDDEFLVYVTKTADTEDVKANTLGLLNELAGLKNTAKVFKSKVYVLHGKRVMAFKLIPNLGRGIDMSVQHLRTYEDLHPLSDRQLAALKFALQHDGVGFTRGQKAGIEGIESSDVEDDYLIVGFKPRISDADVEKIIKHLTSKLNTIVGFKNDDPLAKGNFSATRIIIDGNEAAKIKLHAVRVSSFNQAVFATLVEQLGLPRKQSASFKSIIKGDLKAKADKDAGAAERADEVEKEIRLDNDRLKLRAFRKEREDEQKAKDEAAAKRKAENVMKKRAADAKAKNAASTKSKTAARTAVNKTVVKMQVKKPKPVTVLKPSTTKTVIKRSIKGRI